MRAPKLTNGDEFDSLTPQTGTMLYSLKPLETKGTGVMGTMGTFLST